MFSQHSGMSEKGRLQTQGLLRLRQDNRQTGKKVLVSDEDEHFLVHGFYHLRHFSCDSPVRFMMYSQASDAFISLHSDNTVSLFKSKLRKQALMGELPFLGLTATNIPGWIIGWGPGPIFTLLDSELRHLDTADDALDIGLCEPAEHSWELVTAGVGNVCVWSVLLMRCKLKIQEGLQQHRTFTQLTLAPPRKDRPHRAFVAWGKVVTVVDLDGGMVLDHMEDLCSSDITAMLFCIQLDCLIIASQDLSITVWGPDWVPHVTFLGHKDVVNSLFYCSKSNLLISCSADCTIRCWDVENSMAVDCVYTEQSKPPLCFGGTKNGHPCFSFSAKGVDLWILTAWYTLHSKLRGDEGVPLKQILVSHFPPSYPTRVVCVSADGRILLVSASTGAVLTYFKPEDRIICADYCLHKELLLALTEEGTLLQASTLTNPATVIQEWEGRGQGPWQHTECGTKRDAWNLPVPGPACCLVLYSSVTDPQTALEKWKSLREGKGCSQKNNRYVDNFKNKFWIIIGQRGGCVSVLTVDDGKVLCRTPAHNGHSVTAMQVYPKNNFLLTSGEDFTVVVWRVHPDSAVYLSQQQTVECGQPQVHLAALELQLALTFQDPYSGSYGIKLFNLQSQKQLTYQQNNAHLDSLTGVCEIPGPKVFVSSSLDKTVRIWNERNQLIWMQQLVAVPQCIAYSGNGELFLGIKGDLYRMEFAQFLPKKYRQKFSYNCFEDPLSDLPVPEIKETHDQTDMSNCKTEQLPKAICRNQVLSVNVQQDKEQLSIRDLNRKALKGIVNCPKETKQIRKEAFDCYMGKLYGLPPCKMIGPEDDFEEILFDTKTHLFQPHYFSKLKEDTVPQPKQDIQSLKPQETKKAPMAVRKEISAPAQEVILKKQVGVKKAEASEEIIIPVKQSQPRLQTPPPKIPSPPPQREPSPELPTFLKQFAEMEWFTDLYPDKKSVPSNFSPEDLSLQLLNYLQNYSRRTDIKILAVVQALQILQQQNFLNTTEELYTGLTDALETLIRPAISDLDRVMILEMLNLLVSLKSEIGYDLVKKLLALLAYKQLNLRVPVLRLLGALGINQAQLWLYPELESWGLQLENQSNQWESLHDKADCWMELWKSKFKDYNRYLYLRSPLKQKPPSFSAVDVLNFFCLVQKEEHRKISVAPSAGPKYKVLLPQQTCISFKPILRLGETNTMARKRKLRGVLLPPMHKHFPNWITLHLSRVILRPFHTNTYERLVRLPIRSYFIPQQSTVEYYRRQLKDKPATIPPTCAEPSTRANSESI
ncbi:WD repeat-containing protein 97 isoform X1 [Girardinichthys multiradiatus]|uniref:WD repeat-containing protein 97 isoform X1 n=1 Tax=Girardinichthys multiradiatus TaxID=208333 RepID=UPI001FAD5531|nr:WD repeat-containing protein 97 isoform X1 [Girardinichthys multiradiatus]